MPRDRIYTRTGDDGTTGLFYGGRVRKDSEHPTAYGTVDEVQAVLGLARATSDDRVKVLDRQRTFFQEVRDGGAVFRRPEQDHVAPP